VVRLVTIILGNTAGSGQRE